MQNPARFFVAVVVWISSAAFLSAATPAVDEKPMPKQELTAEEKAAKERVDFMFASASGFEGKRKSDNAKLKIYREPLLRFTNPLHGCRAGLFVAWVDPNNRPVAVGQVFLMRNTTNNWYIETQSLSESSMYFKSKTDSIWNPRRAGIKWTAFGKKRQTHPRGLRWRV